MTGIAKRFGATAALSGVNLNVERGEVHALVGENGSGKSTLMRVLAGAIEPDSGSMTLDGKPYRPRDPKEARKMGVAMIYQELALCGHLSVAENILLGVEPSNGIALNRSEIESRSKEAMAKLGHSAIDVWQQTRFLPLSMRQLVEIGRAVAVGASVVVFDEPTSSLTEEDVKLLFNVIRTLRDDGHAVIYISHFLDEIEQIADRLTVLRDGESVGTRKVDEVSQQEIIEMMVGRKIETLYPRSKRAAGETLLELDGLCGFDKPDSASLVLRRGEVMGIAGLNGSGRTELLRAIFALDPIRSGKLKIAGNTVPPDTTKRWREGIGLLSEDRKEEGLALRLSLAENKCLPSMKGPLVSPGDQLNEMEDWIKRLSIRCQGPAQAAGELSGGNQQKVALARLLDPSIDVMLLDEPTRGIDVSSKEQIYRLIDNAATEGKAVLVVSSYLPELMGICDRIAVMHRGCLGEPRPVADWTAESLMHEAVGA